MYCKTRRGSNKDKTRQNRGGDGGGGEHVSVEERLKYTRFSGGNTYVHL